MNAEDAARHAPGEQQTDPVSTTFFEFLSRLHQDEFTGVIVLHFAQGRPKVVEQPGPSVQVRLRD